MQEEKQEQSSKKERKPKLHRLPCGIPVKKEEVIDAVNEIIDYLNEHG